MENNKEGQPSSLLQFAHKYPDSSIRLQPMPNKLAIGIKEDGSFDTNKIDSLLERSEDGFYHHHVTVRTEYLQQLVEVFEADPLVKDILIHKKDEEDSTICCFYKDPMLANMTALGPVQLGCTKIELSQGVKSLLELKVK